MSLEEYAEQLLIDPHTIPAAYRRFARGSLIVEAGPNCQLGISDTVIPEGSIGFVQGALNDTYAVHWPWLNKHGVVKKANVTAKGRQPI